MPAKPGPGGRCCATGRRTQYGNEVSPFIGFSTIAIDKDRIHITVRSVANNGDVIEIDDVAYTKTAD